MSEQPDPMMARISVAIEQSRAGKTVAAAAESDAIWAEIGGAAGDPFHRCVQAITLLCKSRASIRRCT
ncbi:hypothetical protein [Pseudonocardia asaccharolytica]|nr:hypothetical protein [Pseudonocardia asaccharolytica]